MPSRTFLCSPHFLRTPSNQRLLGAKCNQVEYDSVCLEEQSPETEGRCVNRWVDGIECNNCSYIRYVPIMYVNIGMDLSIWHNVKNSCDIFRKPISQPLQVKIGTIKSRKNSVKQRRALHLSAKVTKNPSSRGKPLLSHAVCRVRRPEQCCACSRASSPGTGQAFSVL